MLVLNSDVEVSEDFLPPLYAALAANSQLAVIIPAGNDYAKRPDSETAQRRFAFVELLMLAGEAGLDAVTVACELTLEVGIVSAPLVMNELRRLIEPHLPAAAIHVPGGIALIMELLANYHRYDYLLESANVH